MQIYSLIHMQVGNKLSSKEFQQLIINNSHVYHNQSKIHESIQFYQYWLLKEIPINDIFQHINESIDFEKIKHYQTLDLTAMPPIILTDFSFDYYYIIDGRHRCQSVMASKQSKIKAFVGIKN